MNELRSSVDPATWARAEEALSLVAQLYGGALDRVLDILVDADAGELLSTVVGDELIGSLLVIHGLHPDDIATRVTRALDKVRPYLASHGGDVELLGIDAGAGVVGLRLLGSCDGCPSSSITLKLAVEQAIHDAAPEVVRIDVEGYTEPEPPPVTSTPVNISSKPVSVSP